MQLGRRVGLKIDLTRVDSRQAASRMIDHLRLLHTRMNGKAGNGYSNEERDKRVAFGMATKLVFKKYLDRHKEVRKSKKFWEEVAQLYEDFQREQERAVSSPHFISADSLQSA